jgi:hypothetical protein
MEKKNSEKETSEAPVIPFYIFNVFAWMKGDESSLL